MNQYSILLPGFVFCIYSILFVFYLGLRRYLATKKRKVGFQHYKSFYDNSERESLHVLNRHTLTLFEIPAVFYAVIVFIAIMGTNSIFLESLAWLFILVRFVYTFIHLNFNKAEYRLYSFGTSLGILLIMTSCAAWQTLQLVY